MFYFIHYKIIKYIINFFYIINLEWKDDSMLHKLNKSCIKSNEKNLFKILFFIYLFIYYLFIYFNN